jgi:hypothetical protein
MMEGSAARVKCKAGNAERYIDAGLSLDRERLQCKRSMRSSDQNLCAGAKAKRNVAARSYILTRQGAMVYTASRREHGPGHDSGGPYSEVRAEAVYVSGIVVGWTAIAR